MLEIKLNEHYELGERVFVQGWEYVVKKIAGNRLLLKAQNHSPFSRETLYPALWHIRNHEKVITSKEHWFKKISTENGELNLETI